MMLNTGQGKRFFHMVEQLRDKDCWAVVAGEGTGTHISINLGEKIPCDKPWIQNITTDLDRFDAEYSVFVEEASWRLDAPDRVICTSTDSNHNGGVMERGLNSLEGTRVTAAEVSTPGYDLILEFSNGCRLTIFCCSSNEVDEWGDNYTLLTPQGNFIVSKRSALTYENYIQPA